MVNEGIECVENIRARYDGEKRNPWDEPECGHHYARAMSSWSTIVSLSGFVYDGPRAAVLAVPRMPHDNFKCFWSTGTGWGTFTLRKQNGSTQFSIKVLKGSLACRSCEIAAMGATSRIELGGKSLAYQASSNGERLVVTLNQTQQLAANDELRITVRG
jgi:hypothetical protein